jgi:hypothetical protein
MRLGFALSATGRCSEPRNAEPGAALDSDEERLFVRTRHGQSPSTSWSCERTIKVLSRFARADTYFARFASNGVGSLNSGGGTARLRRRARPAGMHQVPNAITFFEMNYLAGGMP